MISIPTTYSYKGHQRDRLTFRPHCHAAGTPAILVEGPGAALYLDLLSVEPFIADLRAAAAATRRNAAVTRRPWSPKWAA